MLSMIEPTHTAEARVSQGTQIPEPVKPWVSVLMARHFNRDLNICIRQMSEEEALDMIGTILANQGAMTRFLNALDLPEPEDGGFWMGTVLPLLRKPSTAQKAAPALASQSKSL